MKKYSVNLVPGPVIVPNKVLEMYSKPYPSPDLDKDFLLLYNSTEKKLQEILETKNQIMIQTGEGMLGLWGALKSCLKPEDKVLAICTGVFGFGIADMAQSIGANVKRLEFGYNETISDFNEIEKWIDLFKPKMITMVHCETPSGTLNPLEKIGELKEKYSTPLLCVDSVASAGGTPVEVDKNHIDLCLNGSQKCLSAPADMTFVSISPKAWEIIEDVNYIGYDAFKPFKTAQENFFFPCTPHWHGVAALNTAASLILDEGLQNCYNRHEQVAKLCRKHLIDAGFELFPKEGAILSPTVTAVNIPEKISWQTFQEKLLSKA